eukprot:3935711-Rhodomonas_salina.1
MDWSGEEPGCWWGVAQRRGTACSRRCPGTTPPPRQHPHAAKSETGTRMHVAAHTSALTSPLIPPSALTSPLIPPTSVLEPHRKLTGSGRSKSMRNSMKSRLPLLSMSTSRITPSTTRCFSLCSGTPSCRYTSLISRMSAGKQRLRWSGPPTAGSSAPALSTETAGLVLVEQLKDAAELVELVLVDPELVHDQLVLAHLAQLSAPEAADHTVLVAGAEGAERDQHLA